MLAAAEFLKPRRHFSLATETFRFEPSSVDFFVPQQRWPVESLSVEKDRPPTSALELHLCWGAVLDSRKRK
jgi:hypothetical protein